MNILITGGASGLGEAITKKLLADKLNHVYFTYNGSGANAEKITSEFSNTTSIKCDFKDAADINELKNKVSELDIDILINNAYTGDAIKSYFHKISADDFMADFENNIIPTVLITQSVINHFRKKKKGKIITILTSFLLNTPPIGSSVYVATKAYLKSLVNSWATENARFNITSNSVSPSFMVSNLTKDVDGRVIEQIIENHPLKQILPMEDVADTVSFLVQSSFHLNGVDIPINAASNIK